MGAVPGAKGLPPSKVVPRGLGTGAVESFTGYAARMSARIAVRPQSSSDGRFKTPGVERTYRCGVLSLLPLAASTSANVIRVSLLRSDA